ncbi:SapC family protein [Pseudokordiimonas caeni]|uniref:SapC family protein n=1 Tax=Pseudokordiimonas caeni TaxID=2997908 RepID=UPI002811B7EC|nr:SapC family protein [Pseudokordiimonas caeni]
MTRHALLNNGDHQNLRIITRRAAELGDGVMYVPTFPFEFRAVQAHYPILFHQDASTGRFHALAMFGFERGENLFLTGDGWDAHYVPLAVQRQPFLIGQDGRGERVVHIDLDSPRVSSTEGEPLFQANGANTPYLEHIAAVLDAIHKGGEEAAAFTETLVGLGLLESLALDVELADGSKNRLMGFHVINEDKLMALDSTTLADLNARGYLAAIYMVLASLSHIRDLIVRKNARLGGK